MFTTLQIPIKTYQILNETIKIASKLATCSVCYEKLLSKSASVQQRIRNCSVSSRASDSIISDAFGKSNTMVNHNKHFKFTDYDCIGFDLDNTVARYKVGAMIEMEYEVMANFLVEKGYSKEYLLKPFDHNFILKGLIVDDENGNLLRISPSGLILQAAHGTKMLTNSEIERYYPKKHWEPADTFARDPLVTWNGPYSEKMRTLLDYFDIATSLIFARAVDAVDKQNNGQPQDKYYIWPDLLESLQDMFDRTHFQSEKGIYFKEMKSTPEKYYYPCSEKMLLWLTNLKKMGKTLFLITGSHIDFASHTASNTIGPNWRDFFDIVVCFAKKPGFFTMRREFIGVDGLEETGPVTVDQLKLGGIYTHGNWTDLHNFLERHIDKPNPQFLYVGDNLIQDIYTPNRHSHCETVVVCEELEAEGMHGHQQWHPDMQFLMSTVWGSYFHCNNQNTNWYDIMMKHSKLCVPSLEYVAALPIDHPYQCKDKSET